MIRPAFFSLLVFAMVGNADAVLVGVDFNDADGPHWTGVVNTLTDSLTIETWIENPGGHSFWTLGSLPQVWTARSGGGAFDVPDDWDGTIGLDWAFLPTEFNNSLIDWNEGSHLITSSSTGWGGRNFSDGSIQANVTETTMFDVPTGATSNRRTVEGVVTISAIPEASPLLIWGTLACLACCTHIRRKK